MRLGQVINLKQEYKPEQLSKKSEHSKRIWVRQKDFFLKIDFQQIIQDYSTILESRFTVRERQTFAAEFFGCK